MELTTDVLLYGSDAFSDEVNTSIFKAVQLNSPSVSLRKNNKIILTLYDRFSGYLGGWRTNCFAVCARSLSSMITL